MFAYIQTIKMPVGSCLRGGFACVACLYVHTYVQSHAWLQIISCTFTNYVHIGGSIQGWQKVVGDSLCRDGTDTESIVYSLYVLKPSYHETIKSCEPP